MKLLITISFLLFVCNIYSQTTPTVAVTVSSTANINYKRADSIALNFQRNKYYFYQETAQELVESLTSEKEKCRAIFRWISNNIKYEFDVLNNKKECEDPLLVYKRKKAVCGGYAALFKAMCDEAKIKCLDISGEVLPGHDSHAWNIVLLDGSWYIMDVTWAAGYLSGNLVNPKFKRDFDEKWWMANQEEAIKMRVSDDSYWKQYIVGEKKSK
jgi:transglutaminase/protease-like cytokinesis protein 3